MLDSHWLFYFLECITFGKRREHSRIFYKQKADHKLIEVKDISKRYKLGQIRGYKTVRESLQKIFSNRKEKEDIEYIWALRDVSFNVKEGEVLGVIGRNGAGKTTLLKVLTRITEPTEGIIKLKGRVASLLEVGTGFHPELTGRENIFLNGAILGMKRAEIQAKFDEIVDFAEVEKFIDTPVKRYSSGMYVRLAFAVAAHLEPEILLVDEVLAVGDFQFQKKCLGKMQDTTESGRTILFVSHNMGAIRQLCPNCLWIDKGKLKQYDLTSKVVNSYLKAGNLSELTGEIDFKEKLQKDFQLRVVRLMSSEGVTTQKFDCDEPVIIELDCQVRSQIPGLYAYLSISKRDGAEVMVSDSFDDVPNPIDNLSVGMHRISVTIPARTLGPGDYYVSINFTSRFSDKGFDVESPGEICTFSLDDLTSSRGNQRGGYFSTLLKWNVTGL